MNLYLSLTSYTKINSKWIMNLNIKCNHKEGMGAGRNGPDYKRTTWGTVMAMLGILTILMAKSCL